MCMVQKVIVYVSGGVSVIYFIRFLFLFLEFLKVLFSNIYVRVYKIFECVFLANIINLDDAMLKEMAIKRKKYVYVYLLLRYKFPSLQKPVPITRE